MPPPGPGVNTSTGTVPAARKSLAGIVAVSWVGLTYWVDTLLPLPHCTTEHGRKLPPFTVSVSAGLPTKPVAGINEVMAEGPAKFAVGVVMVKESVLDVPDELVTETAAEELAIAVSIGRIVALS